ncbi:MAG: metallophosphoesterase [Alphaproteobacteria bacterium]|nr:metallophosphoesterase [Alphaproteobacteria bacterium]
MKRFLYAFLYALLVIVLFLILREFFPKNAEFLRYFLFFLLFDVYLWWSVKGNIINKNPFIRGLLALGYWLPLGLLTGLVVYGYLHSFLHWNLFLRIYSQSLVLTFFIAKVFPIFTLLLSDLIRWLEISFHLIFPENPRWTLHPVRIKALLNLGWILGGITFILLLTGTIYGQFRFKTTKIDLIINELPASFDGLRIVQVSDVHLGSWSSEKRLRDAVLRVNDEKPDLLFITGDLFTFCTADGDRYFKVLKMLRAKEGIYYVMGNHDYGDYLNWKDTLLKRKNMTDLEKFFTRLKWNLLRNEYRIVHRGNDSIAVIGVENWGITKRFQRFGDVGMAQKGIEKIKIKLLLTHDPTHWEYIVSKQFKDIDVTFSGHTHGGQIGLEWKEFKWGPALLTQKYWCGLYKTNDGTSSQYLYVNQGLGTVAYAGRIGIDPEITVFTLKKSGTGISGNIEKICKLTQY